MRLDLPHEGGALQRQHLARIGGADAANLAIGAHEPAPLRLIDVMSSPFPLCTFSQSSKSKSKPFRSLAAKCGLWRC